MAAPHSQTVLYQLGQCDIERGAPLFVKRESQRFARCGVLAHGFARFRCSGCGTDRLVAFSCKGRGFCPSCGGRRTTERAAYLIDDVLPRVPVRQWGVSLTASASRTALREGPSPRSAAPVRRAVTVSKGVERPDLTLSGSSQETVLRFGGGARCE